MEGDIVMRVGFGYSAFISIHSLRMEGDLGGTQQMTVINISIHSLRMEGDATTFTVAPLYLSFQSTPSAWRETISDLFCPE